MITYLTEDKFDKYIDNILSKECLKPQTNQIILMLKEKNINL